MILDILEVKTRTKTQKRQVAVVAKEVKEWLDGLDETTRLRQDEQIVFMLDKAVLSDGLLVVKYNANITEMKK